MRLYAALVQEQRAVTDAWLAARGEAHALSVSAPGSPEHAAAQAAERLCLAAVMQFRRDCGELFGALLRAAAAETPDTALTVLVGDHAREALAARFDSWQRVLAAAVRKVEQVQADNGRLARRVKALEDAGRPAGLKVTG